MKFASLLIDMNFIGQAEAPQYHFPELSRLNTLRVPGSTGQAGQAKSAKKSSINF